MSTNKAVEKKYEKSLSRGKTRVRRSFRTSDKNYPVACQKTVYGSKLDIDRAKTEMSDNLLLLYGVNKDACKLVKHIFINYKRNYIIKNGGVISDREGCFGLDKNRYQLVLLIDKLIRIAGDIRVGKRGAHQVKNDWNNCISNNRNCLKKSILYSLITYGCAAFNVAHKDGLVPFNPVDATFVNREAKLKRKRKNIHSDIELTQNDFEDFLDIIPYAYWPVSISADTSPLRVNEGLNAKRPSIQSIDTEKIPIQSEKNEPPRNLYINSSLKHFMQHLPEDSEYAFPIYENGQLNKIDYFVFRRDFKIAVTFIGKPNLHIHDFRSFVSSRMKKLGMSNTAIQQCGGWLDIGSFEKYYLRNSDDEGHAAAKFTELLRKAFIQLGYDPENLLFAPANSPADGFAWDIKNNKTIHYKDDLTKMLIEITNQ